MKDRDGGRRREMDCFGKRQSPPKGVSVNISCTEVVIIFTEWRLLRPAASTRR